MEHESGKQNITIAEIAKRAGVSTATVSYVLSDRQDVKIGEETRGRILALCSELGYQKGAKRKTAAKKQITIDDIAREAGVSTATVSYIVNDRKDVKISEETRKRCCRSATCGSIPLPPSHGCWRGKRTTSSASARRGADILRRTHGIMRSCRNCSTRFSAKITARSCSRPP